MIIPGNVYKRYACGCYLDYHAMPYELRIEERTKSGQKRRIRVCPFCRTPEARFVESFKVCPECGELATTKIGSLSPGNCRACGYEQYKESRRGIQKATLERQYRLERQKAQAARDRYDCKHRDRCLVRHIDEPYLPCLDCVKYVRQEVKLTRLTCNHDPCQWAYGEAI